MELIPFLQKNAIKNKTITDDRNPLWDGFEFDLRDPVDNATLTSAKSAGKQIITLHTDMFLMNGMWRVDRECHFILDKEVSTETLEEIIC